MNRKKLAGIMAFAGMLAAAFPALAFKALGYTAEVVGQKSALGAPRVVVVPATPQSSRLA